MNGLRGHTGCPTAYCKEAEAYQINISHPTTHSIPRIIAPHTSSSSSSASSGFGNGSGGSVTPQADHRRLPNISWIFEKLCRGSAVIDGEQSPVTTTSSSSSVLPPAPPFKASTAVIDLTADSSSDDNDEDEDEENEVARVSSSSSNTVKLVVNETKAAKKRDATISAVFDHYMDSLIGADPCSTKRKAKLPLLTVPIDGIYPPLTNVFEITARVLQPLRAKLNAALEKSKSVTIYGYNPESSEFPMWPHKHCGHCNKGNIEPDDDTCPDCSCDVVECYDYSSLTDAVCWVRPHLRRTYY